MADVVYQTAAIAQNASLSGAVNIGEKVAVGILMPGAWDTANLTFQGAVDPNGTFSNIYDSSGNELTVTAAAGRYILLDPTTFVGLTQIKIRSGTSVAAVNQTTGARTLTVVTR